MQEILDLLDTLGLKELPPDNCIAICERLCVPGAELARGLRNLLLQDARVAWTQFETLAALCNGADAESKRRRNRIVGHFHGQNPVQIYLLACEVVLIGLYGNQNDTEKLLLRAWQLIRCLAGASPPDRLPAGTVFEPTGLSTPISGIDRVLNAFEALRDQGEIAPALSLVADLAHGSALEFLQVVRERRVPILLIDGTNQVSGKPAVHSGKLYHIRLQLCTYSGGRAAAGGVYFAPINGTSLQLDRRANGVIERVRSDCQLTGNQDVRLCLEDENGRGLPPTHLNDTSYYGLLHVALKHLLQDLPFPEHYTICIGLKANGSPDEVDEAVFRAKFRAAWRASISLIVVLDTSRIIPEKLLTYYDQRNLDMALRPQIEFVTDLERASWLIQSFAPASSSPSGSDFTQRKEDVDKVKSLLSGSRSLVITGKEGVGKSLVARAVCREQDRWMLYEVDCRNLSSAESLRSAICARFRQANEQDIWNNFGTDHFLLFLDNLSLPEQELPGSITFLEEFQSRVANMRLLMTTSLSLDLPDAISYCLNVPDIGEAVMLFNKALRERHFQDQQDGIRMRILVERLGRDPRLILHYAGILRSEPAKTMHDLLEELDDLHDVSIADQFETYITMAYSLLSKQSTHSSDVANAKSLSQEDLGRQLDRIFSEDIRVSPFQEVQLARSIYESLSSDAESGARHLFRVLSLLPVGASDALAERLLGNQAKMAIAELLHRGLLEQFQDRIRLLGWANTFAHTLELDVLKTEQEAITRIHDYLREEMETALSHLCTQNCRLATQWLKTERANIQQAILRASGRGDHALVCSLGVGLSRLYWFRNEIGGEEWLRKALDAARSSGDRGREVQCLCYLGDLKLRLPDYNMARDLYTEAEAISFFCKDKIGYAQAITGLADCFRYQGPYTIAQQYYVRAEQRLRSYTNSLRASPSGREHALLRVAHALKGRADTLRLMGELDRADALYQQALTSYTQTAGALDLLGIGNCQIGLAEINIDRGEYPQAAQHYREALKNYGEIDAIIGQADAWRGLARICRLQDDMANARLYEQRSQQFGAHKKNWLSEANLTYEQAENGRQELKLIGRAPIEREKLFDEVRGLYVTAKGIYTKLGVPRQIARCHKGLADLYRIEGRVEDAMITYQLALRHYLWLPCNTGRAACLRGMGRVSFMQQNYGEARHYFKEAKRLYRCYGRRLGEAHCQRHLADVLIAEATMGTGSAQQIAKKREDAEKIYRETMRSYQSIGDQEGIQLAQRALEELASMREGVC